MKHIVLVNNRVHCKKKNDKKAYVIRIIIITDKSKYSVFRQNIITDRQFFTFYYFNDKNQFPV